MSNKTSTKERNKENLNGFFAEFLKIHNFSNTYYRSITKVGDSNKFHKHIYMPL